MLYIQILETVQLAVKLMEKTPPLQSILRNGDLVKIIISKKVSPSLALAYLQLGLVRHELLHKKILAK